MSEMKDSNLTTYTNIIFNLKVTLLTEKQLKKEIYLN